MGMMIDNLRWRPKWASHMGCLKGCLDYLGMDISDGWLYGATGHAFIINVHEVVCPSGPTAWNTEMLFKLSRNIGLIVERVFASRRQPDFAEKQKRAWENTKRAIDEGLPCYGWELDIPEYYVVYGCDEQGYYFSGPHCNSGKGPKPWQEVGNSQIGVLEMMTVKRCPPADDPTTVREALQFALDHSKSPESWIFPKYKSGLAAYDNWIQALEHETADAFGMAYNAAVWSECRHFAVEFLKEAKGRLPRELATMLDEAAKHYETVAENLAKVRDLFPFPPKGDEVQNRGRSEIAWKNLRAVRAAEAAGLQALGQLLATL